MKVKTKDDMYRITNSTLFVLSELQKILNKEIGKYQNSTYPRNVQTTNNFIKSNLKRGMIPREVRGGRLKKYISF